MIAFMKALRNLPPIHLLQRHPQFSLLQKDYSIPQETLTKWLTEQVDMYREQILQGKVQVKNADREQLTTEIIKAFTKRVQLFATDQLQQVINATGVVLHTNLGRARLSKQATEQMVKTATSYSTLEYDLATGERGSRHDIVEEYMKQLTGAEAALVVNNNAAAVYFVLKAMASGQEVILSRGELVEIGGSFRISEIMEESGALLKSVGTSNKTYVADYEQGITDETALLMKVHKSNFSMIGFTEEVETSELKALAAKHSLPIYEDLGSGTLFDFQEQKIGSEPTVKEKIHEGIDLLSFSGDKLLGGPQAGIIVGKKHYIEHLKKHQLARVLRVDKFTLAALEATLKTYIRGEAAEEIPTVKDIVTGKEAVLKKAESFVEQVRGQLPSFTWAIHEDISKVGGGTMPAVTLETYVVSVQSDLFTSEQLARKLRGQQIPLIVRVQEERILLDFRTVTNEEIRQVVEGFMTLEGKAH